MNANDLAALKARAQDCQVAINALAAQPHGEVVAALERTRDLLELLIARLIAREERRDAARSRLPAEQVPEFVLRLTDFGISPDLVDAIVAVAVGDTVVGKVVATENALIEKNGVWNAQLRVLCPGIEAHGVPVGSNVYIPNVA